MKIAFVLTQSIDSPGGSGRFGPIARELVKLGHEVELFALHPAFETLTETTFAEHGVHIRYVGQMHVRKDSGGKQYFSTSELLRVALNATLQLTRAVFRSDADVIQVCKTQPFNIMAAMLGRRGRPVFVDCDDYEAAINNFGGRWQRRIVQFFEDNVRRFASGMTVNTTFSAERYASLGYPPHKIIHVPNGVERDRFTNIMPRPRLESIPDSAPIVLYFGALTLHSHPVDLLLNAFSQITSDIPAAHLVLIGGGADRDKLEKQQKSLSCHERIHFVGRVSPEEIPSWLTTATVTVEPVYDDLVGKSRAPLKIVESLAAGIPVITGDVGDRRQQLFDGKCGVVVEPGSAEALANALREVLQSKNKRAAFANAARSIRETLFWDQLAEKFEQVYSL